jgi:hypothetical protein
MRCACSTPLGKPVEPEHATMRSPRRCAPTSERQVSPRKELFVVPEDPEGAMSNKVTPAHTETDHALTLAATYQRQVEASAERILENVFTGNICQPCTTLTSLQLRSWTAASGAGGYGFPARRAQRNDSRCCEFRWIARTTAIPLLQRKASDPARVIRYNLPHWARIAPRSR